jgi:hypothetical protein
MRDEGAEKRVHRACCMLIAATCLLLVVILVAGCGKKPRGEVLAKVGSRVMTTADLTLLAGRSADSLTKTERWQLVEGWIERTLAGLEGERRHFDKRSDVRLELDMLRGDLYAAKLLAEIPAAAPTDVEVQTYYDAHRKEFLRPVDAYLLELYWAEYENIMSLFRRQLERGDTSMVTAGDVSSEGRWLAESGELDAAFERELSSLKPGEVTFPRPYEDGFRLARLVESYPAGTVLDLSVVRDEIVARLLLAESHRRQDSLQTSLRDRFPVMLFINDSL